MRGGKCIHGGECEKCCMACKAICHHCGAIHVGDTQDSVKSRFQVRGGGHSQVCRAQANRPVGVKGMSMSLSTHMVNHVRIDHWGRHQGFTVDNFRPTLKIKLAWIGNPFSCMKSHRTIDCKLCMKERYHIFNHRMKDTKSLINSSLDIHHGCNHNPKFHGFLRDPASGGNS